MKKINIVPLRSLLSVNDELLDQEQNAYLNTLASNLNVQFVQDEETPITLFLIETGGTEEAFLKCFENYKPPYYLLTTDKRNSLPAALEIGAFLGNRQLPYSIIHGQVTQVTLALRKIIDDYQQNQTSYFRLGVIGKPSDWLIASNLDRDYAKDKYQVLFVDISFQEFSDELNKKSYNQLQISEEIIKKAADSPYLDGALHIYGAIKRLVHKHDLQGFTIRCFDLLNTYKNTACLALALLNEEGIVAGCEGDLPILLSMHLVKKLLNLPAFQANPSSIDLEQKRIVFAHCTIPSNMCLKKEYMTHFESGLGIGIRGTMQTGPCTIFRLAANLQSVYIEEGEIIENTTRDDLCRTQIIVRMNQGLEKLLAKPLGNHQLIIYGHHKETLTKSLKALDSNLRIVWEVIAKGIYYSRWLNI